METLKDIFDHYDHNKDGKINNIAFKLVINLINLPIINCTNKYYTYDDLLNYIKKYGQIKKPITKTRIRKLLNSNESIAFGTLCANFSS